MTNTQLEKLLNKQLPKRKDVIKMSLITLDFGKTVFTLRFSEN